MFLSRSTSENAAVDAAQGAADAVQVLRELPLEVVLPNPSQPRRRFDEEALRELAGSMSEHGVLQPVLVRPLQDGKYQLVAGERRWRAAQLAGLQSIPALASRYDDCAALEVGLIENVARKDLNPVEEARACATLVQELGLTQTEVGRRVGRGRVMVNSLIGLLRLSDEILELLERGELTASHGIELLLIKDPQTRSRLARAAVEGGWSVLALEGRVRASNMDVLQPVGSKEQGPDRRQARDLAALNLATAWGKLLGVEVHVRVLAGGRMRMEVLFGSAAEGIALADRLSAAIARGSKGK